MMREHIPQDTRIHYVITKGGEAPTQCTIAEVYYYARHRQSHLTKYLKESKMQLKVRHY